MRQEIHNVDSPKQMSLVTTLGARTGIIRDPWSLFFAHSYLPQMKKKMQLFWKTKAKLKIFYASTCNYRSIHSS